MVWDSVHVSSSLIKPIDVLCMSRGSSCTYTTVIDENSLICVPKKQTHIRQNVDRDVDERSEKTHVYESVSMPR